jgi:hypothetical protein
VERFKSRAMKFVPLFASIALLGPSALPAAAGSPTWANAVARSYCHYRSLGASPSAAMKQARRDKDHWDDEIREAGSLAKPAINAAIRSRC